MLRIAPLSSVTDLAGQLAALMEVALPPEERDDRFTQGGPAAAMPHGALAWVGHRPVGYVGGAIDGSRLDLDALIAPEDATGVDPTVVLASLLDAVVGSETAGGDGSPSPVTVVELWGRPAQPWHHAVATGHRMREHRALHQMRCPLPVDIEPVPTRPFEPGDLDELVRVNNRAFASHPDQGGQTPATVGETMRQPWFRPDGLRVYTEADRMAGFCWTKIHPSPPAPTPLGEIFVICIDPDFHGRGLGQPMTAAGLDWLHGQGLTMGMLYVEADNVPAVKTYERLGFTVLRTDRSWRWTLGTREAPSAGERP